MVPVRCIRNKALQFAKSLYNSMHGAGTKDESLIRTVITRCEVDMVQIKQEFERAYKGSLGEWIKVRQQVLKHTSKITKCMQHSHGELIADLFRR